MMKALTLLSIFAVLVAARPVFAANEEAKAAYKRGLSLYALERYGEAAIEYEKAFELEPDPALLYNAAQAHRLAGNKQRALALYQNYLRLFPNPENKRDVERHIAALKTAIDREGEAQRSPPTEPLPPSPAVTPAPAPNPPPPAVEPAPAPSPATAAPEPAPAVTTHAPPSPRKKTPGWVWGVVGGVGAAAVLGVALGLGFGLSGVEYPSPAIGTAHVQ